MRGLALTLGTRCGVDIGAKFFAWDASYRLDSRDMIERRHGHAVPPAHSLRSDVAELLGQGANTASDLDCPSQTFVAKSCHAAIKHIVERNVNKAFMARFNSVCNCPGRRRDMGTLGQRIEEARLRAGKTLAEVGKACGGKTPQAVKNWQDGKSKPSGKDLMTLSDFLGVSFKWLIYGVDESPANGNLGDQLGGRTVPQIDWSNVGILKNEGRTIASGVVRTHFPCGINSFAVKAVDRSNEAGTSDSIEAGSSVVIDPDEPLVPGDYCLAVVDGEPMIRLYRPRGTYIELVPANPNWPTVHAQLDDIIGPVTETTKPRRR